MKILSITKTEIPGTKIGAWECFTNPSKTGDKYLDGYTLVRVRCNGGNGVFSKNTWQLRLVLFNDEDKHEIEIRQGFIEIPVAPDMILKKVGTSIFNGPGGKVGVVTLTLWSEGSGDIIIPVHCTEENSKVPAEESL